MPHSSGAKKRVRQYAKRRLRNRAVKKAIKLQIRQVLDAATGSPEDMEKQFRVAIKKLDKAASKRVIHPNQVARKKSQLARIVQSKSSPAAQA